MGQDFVNESSVWQYGYFNYPYQACIELSHKQDTLIEGKMYREYRTQYSQVFHVILNEDRDDFTGPSHYLRTVGDSVITYFSQREQEALLFDFSAEAGDSWEIVLPYDIDMESMTCTILGTGTDTIGSEILSWQDIEYKSEYISYQERVYSRFGTSVWSLFPWDNHYAEVDRHSYGGLILYTDTDTDFSFGNTESDCNRIISNKEITDLSDISLYPNPTNSQLQIKNLSSGRGYSITITNSKGEHVLTTDNPYNIDCSGLSPGVYLVRIIDSINKYILRMVKL